jgi:two-component system cell cycle sensor histidine kinase/response regulator CckA
VDDLKFSSFGAAAAPQPARSPSAPKAPAPTSTPEPETTPHPTLEQLGLGNQLQERVLCAVANAVVITDSTGTILWVNPAFTLLTGYSREEVVGQNPRLLKSGKQGAEIYRDLWGTVKSGRVWRGEVINRRKDGSEYTEELTITPLKDEAGKVDFFIAIKQDVTERKVLERQVAFAQRLDAIGRLTGGVAHDFNNMLGIILGYADLLRSSLPEESRAAEQVTQIRKAAERSANLTRQLLTFSRRQVVQWRVLNLNDTISDLFKMLRRLIGADVKMEFRPGADLGMVRADAGQIEQVLMNLAVNARDAMPRGGHLLLSTANAQLDEAYTRQHPPATAGDYVMIEVTDTGTGMTEQTRAHIFEPFFTTKEAGKGTGLGLPIVYGIVKQTGGFVWVYSEEGQGSTFKIYLPRVAAVDGSIEAQTPANIAYTGSETVLVVEDETALCEMVVSVLEVAGYTVLEARNGHEALDAAAKHTGPIHLLVTDVILRGGMNGPAVAAAICPLRPDLKVLYTSGYNEEVLSWNKLAHPGANLLQKPFDTVQLRRRVREALDR